MPICSGCSPHCESSISDVSLICVRRINQASQFSVRTSDNETATRNRKPFMSTRPLADQFSEPLRELDPSSDDYVPCLVVLILQQARIHRASDVHLVPAEHQLTMQWRIDGVLHTITGFGAELSPRVIARLKVLSGLLTYRTDIPQEGRIANGSHSDATGEVRITTFPTLYGEKAAIRLFAMTGQFQHLADLGLPADVEDSLRTMLQATSGVILLTGPSGSGKTTSAYACLREIVQLFGDSKGLLTLEDPIEVVVPGVTQSQVRPQVGFDLTAGLKSMMRQDPDVILVGEIRDPETAECAFQAALTGHLVITTFHAGSSVEAVTRLLDLGIEPYLIRSTLRATICQRLLRKVCSECRSSNAILEDSKNCDESLGKADSAMTQSESCQACEGLGYHGRFITAELLDPHQPEIAEAILARVDSRTLDSIANQCGTVTLRKRAEQLINDGLTTREEVFRVLGR